MDYLKWKEQMESEGYTVNGLSLKKEVIIDVEPIEEVEPVKVIETITKVEDISEEKEIEQEEEIDFTQWTKKEFETYAREKEGIELDLRKSKKNMVIEFNEKKGIKDGE